MQLSEILSEKELGTIPADIAVKIESACNKHIADYDAKGDRKFGSLVEAVSGQFNELVNTAVKKKLDGMEENTVNGKLFEALQKIVNVLEECQIETSQVKEAKKAVEKLKGDVQDKIVDYKRAMKELMYAKIADKVLRETNGYKPELQQKAVEYFTNPTLNLNLDDMKREDIINFINGVEDDKISDSEFSGIGETKPPSQIDMTELNEIANSLAMDDIEENGLDNYRKRNMAVNDVRYPIGGMLTGGKKIARSPKVAGVGSTTAAFEALGNGLSQNKVFNSPDVTPEMLNAPTSLNQESDDDVSQAMSMLNTMNGFI
jgi:hypothetical protein